MFTCFLYKCPVEDDQTRHVTTTNVLIKKLVQVQGVQGYPRKVHKIQKTHNRVVKSTKAGIYQKKGYSFKRTFKIKPGLTN